MRIGNNLVKGFLAETCCEHDLKDNYSHRKVLIFNMVVDFGEAKALGKKEMKIPFSDDMVFILKRQ